MHWTVVIDVSVVRVEGMSWHTSEVDSHVLNYRVALAVYAS